MSSFVTSASSPIHFIASPPSVCVLCPPALHHQNPSHCPICMPALRCHAPALDPFPGLCRLCALGGAAQHRRLPLWSGACTLAGPFVPCYALPRPSIAVFSLVSIHFLNTRPLLGHCPPVSLHPYQNHTTPVYRRKLGR